MRLIISVVWPSYLIAVLAAALFFVAFDPADFIGPAAGPAEALRINVYSIGFFLFWALALMSSLLTHYFGKPVKNTVR